MQSGFDPSQIQLLGVNEVGYESGNEDMCAGRSAPWLQDEAETDVWGLWGVEYRDVVVLDAENLPVAAYNLTEHDLSDPDNYAELEQILEEAAR